MPRKRRPLGRSLRMLFDPDEDYEVVSPVEVRWTIISNEPPFRPTVENHETFEHLVPGLSRILFGSRRESPFPARRVTFTCTNCLSHAKALQDLVDYGSRRRWSGVVFPSVTIGYTGFSPTLKTYWEFVIGVFAETPAGQRPVVRVGNSTTSGPVLKVTGHSASEIGAILTLCGGLLCLGLMVIAALLKGYCWLFGWRWMSWFRWGRLAVVAGIGLVLLVAAAAICARAD
jgi:hypothetical protein